ncbi:hypothetical protein MOQ_010272, partial [Trypanosoma cruzi marinkellei]
MLFRFVVGSLLFVRSGAYYSYYYFLLFVWTFAHCVIGAGFCSTVESFFMGCCGSKVDICGWVYIEMLRRLGVTPSCTEDAAALSRRNSEFERILAMNRGKGCDATGAGCATVEQLQMFAHETWQLSSIHAYNE